MERDFKGVWIPREIWLNDALGWSEKLLLVEIDSLAKNGECFAGNEYFAKFLGMSTRQIQHLLKNLKEKNLIQIVNFYRPGTKYVEKRVISPYHEINCVPPRNKLRDPYEENFVTPTKEISHPHEENFVDINTSINTTTNTITDIKEIKKEKKKKEKLEQSQLEEEFALFWLEYPRKEKRAVALKSYIKSRKDKKVSYETIMNGLKRYVEHLKSNGTETEFIMHGSTWLNQSRWDDEFIKFTSKKVTSFLDYYKSEWGEENGFSRHGEVIDYGTTLLP